MVVLLTLKLVGEPVVITTLSLWMVFAVLVTLASFLPLALMPPSGLPKA